jgi:hypothetical protein
MRTQNLDRQSANQPGTTEGYIGKPKPNKWKPMQQQAALETYSRRYKKL